MDPLDAEIEAARAELAALRSESSVAGQPTPTVPTETPWYSPKQLGYDIATGALKAGWGLADLITTPGVALARAGGLDVPYFGISKMGAADLAALAPQVGIQEGTLPQQIVEFATPIPGGGKVDMAKQAGLGLASLLGMKAGESVAPSLLPESFQPYGGLIGALAAPAGAIGATKAATKIAPALEETGLGLQRKALGATRADYKNAKNAVIETVEGNFSTQLKESLNDLIKTKKLGTSLDPAEMYAELRNAKDTTEANIQSVLQSTEKTIGPVPPPSFSNTVDYIAKNIAAPEVDDYLNKVINLQDSLTREGAGSLTYLNQQKKIIGESWKNSPQSDPGFWRTLYKDMKSHIEKYAPEVKDLNKEKQKLIIAEPIVARNFKASGADYDIGAVRRLLDTTGGAGLAGGAILGGAAGSMGTGLAAALALRALSTPTGQNIVGKSLSRLASILPTTTPTKGPLPQIAKEVFANQQPFVHGTTKEGLAAIKESGFLKPETVNYSVLGPGTIYVAKRDSWWFDPEKAAGGRMWELPEQIPVYVNPEAKITTINNDKDWERLARRIDMSGDELMRRLDFEAGASPEKIATANATKQKLLDAGIDAIKIGKVPNTKALNELQSKYLDIYYKYLQQGDTVFNDASVIKRLPYELLDKLKGSVTFNKYIFGDDQLAILNPKSVELADVAYERLLKTNPEKLRSVSAKELSALSPETQRKLLQSGFISAKVAQSATSNSSETPVQQTRIDIDAEIEAARRELESLRGSPMKQDVSFLINDAAERYGVSPKLVNAVVQTESAGKSDAVSPKGAQGLMQLMPKTAKALGVEDPTDPAQNIEGGVKYLAQLIKKFGDEKLALAAYNWGEGNIRKQLDRLAKRDKPQTLAAILKYGTLPSETENYIRKINRLTEEA